MTYRNIIRSQYVHFEVGTGGDPFAIQKASTSWCKDMLLPAIEQQLEKYSTYHEVIYLDVIDIHLDEASLQLNQLLADKIAGSIEHRIRQQLNHHAPSFKDVQSINHSLIGAFVYFLHHGYLPWWSAIKTTQEFNDQLKVIRAEDGVEQRDVLRQVLMKKQSVMRFVASFRDDIVLEMLEWISPGDHISVHHSLQAIAFFASRIADASARLQFVRAAKTMCVDILLDVKQAGQFVQRMSALLLKYEAAEMVPRQNEALHRQPLITEIITAFANLKSNSSYSHEVLQETEQALSLEQSEGEFGREDIASARHKEQSTGIFIDNAGLVLIAPFIPAFFQKLGLEQDGKLVNADLAVGTLQWLATGNEQYAAFDLVLPKILCGLQPEDVVLVFPTLPDLIKEEGLNLLEAVIAHWAVLGNTSTAGLRESFLNRAGKISLQHGEWNMQVEQKAFDMLLENLPWNISMIRLSWMRHLLRTDWIA